MFTFKALIIFLALGVASSGLSAQSLVYEREFTMIAEEGNTLRIELTAAGTLIVERPAFMTHSGRHELKVANSVYAQMSDQLAARSADSRQVSREVQQQAQEEMRYISDPEISRFYRLDEQGRKLDHVSGISLEAWARIYPDNEGLAGLRNLEQRWYQLMQRAVSSEDSR